MDIFSGFVYNFCMMLVMVKEEDLDRIEVPEDYEILDATTLGRRPNRTPSSIGVEVQLGLQAASRCLAASTTLKETRKTAIRCSGFRLQTRECSPGTTRRGARFLVLVRRPPR